MPRLLLERFGIECIREFDRAADERFDDAEALVAADRRTGAIYLFGYVVEMLLKTAFLRLAGHADDELITISILRGYVGDAATSTARSLGRPGSRNLHDISAWADLVVAYREDRKLVYSDSGIRDTLVANVAVVHGRWSEAIRYHKNIAYEHELVKVREACEWIRLRRAEI